MGVGGVNSKRDQVFSTQIKWYMGSAKAENRGERQLLEKDQSPPKLPNALKTHTKTLFANLGFQSPYPWRSGTTHKGKWAH